MGRRLLLALLLMTLIALAVNLASISLCGSPASPCRSDGWIPRLRATPLLQISDLKGATTGSNQALIRFALQNEDFDAVVFTGDMVSSRGNAQPLYALIESAARAEAGRADLHDSGRQRPSARLHELRHRRQPVRPWVLGAGQRGGQLLSAPVQIERDGHTLWLTTSALLSLDMDTMQAQFERQYLDALADGDENAIELTTYNLQWLTETRNARAKMTDADVYIALTHVPPADEELESAYPGSLRERVHLVLCGHYQGGLDPPAVCRRAVHPLSKPAALRPSAGGGHVFRPDPKGTNLSLRQPRSGQATTGCTPSVLPSVQPADGFADFASPRRACKGDWVLCPIAFCCPYEMTPSIPRESLKFSACRG